MPVPEEPKEPVPEEPNDGQTSQKSYVEDASSDAIDAGSLSMAVADLWEASDLDTSMNLRACLYLVLLG